MSDVLKFRVLPADRAALEGAAKAARMTLSAWMRKVLLDKALGAGPPRPPPVGFDDRLDIAVEEARREAMPMPWVATDTDDTVAVERLVRDGFKMAARKV